MSSFHNCRTCNIVYEEPKGAKSAPHIKDYCKYLGFCNQECFEKLSERGKDILMFRALIEGDKLKKNKVPVSKVLLKSSK